MKARVILLVLGRILFFFFWHRLRLDKCEQINSLQNLLSSQVKFQISLHKADLKQQMLSQNAVQKA